MRVHCECIYELETSILLCTNLYFIFTSHAHYVCGDSDLTYLSDALPLIAPEV